MRRFLVTGGAGFIGSHIVEALLARGESVRILDNLSTGKLSNVTGLRGKIELIEGDIREYTTVRAAMRDVEIVFHEAAIASVQASVVDPNETLAVNLTGTQHILSAAHEEGARRVILASSAAIYGDTPALPKVEAMAPQPISPYAVHKLAGEHLCAVFSRLFGIETVALRYFNVFGPRQDPRSEYSGVISRFIDALVEGRRPMIFGDGEQTRDFVFVGDVVRANLLAADAPDAVGRAVNVARGEGTSLKQILAAMQEVIGCVIEPEYRPERPGDIRHSRADIQLGQHLLDYQPRVSVTDGLRETLASVGLRCGS